MQTELEPTIRRERILRAKKFLKGMSTAIREQKNMREDESRDDWHLYLLREEYRIIHIAYCELRGTPRERIEQPSENNLPNENRIASYKEAIISGSFKNN